jgi:hypothetical protein
LGFHIPALRRNIPSLHGVKTQKTTIIITANAEAEEKSALDSCKEDGLEVKHQELLDTATPDNIIL